MTEETRFRRERVSGTLQGGLADRGKQDAGVPLVLSDVSPFSSVVPGRVCKSLVPSQPEVRSAGGEPD